MNYMGVSLRGWSSLASAAMALLVGTGTGIATFGVFLPWLTEQFGWTRGEVSLGLSICMILQTVLSPVAGFFVAKSGARKAIVAGNLIIVLGFLLMGVMQMLWQFCVAYALVGVGFGMCGIIASGTIAANWFGDKSTLAMSVISASAGIGAFVLVPLTSLLIGEIGWRNVYFAIAGLILVLGVMVPFAVIKNSPEDTNEPSRGGPVASAQGFHGGREIEGPRSSVDFTLSQSLRMRVFWLITAYFAVQMFVYTFFLSHQVAYLIGFGMSKQLAAATLGAVAVCSVAGNLAAGALSLKYSVKGLATASAAIVLLGTAIAFFIRASPLAFLFSILFGVGHGAAVVCILSLYSIHFGKKHFPKIFGVSSLLRIAGTAGGPVGGFLFDAQGTYFTALVVMLIVAALGVVLGIFMRPAPRTAPEVLESSAEATA